MTHTLDGKKYRMKWREEIVKEIETEGREGKEGKRERKRKFCCFFIFINH